MTFIKTPNQTNEKISGFDQHQTWYSNLIAAGETSTPEITENPKRSMQHIVEHCNKLNWFLQSRSECNKLTSNPKQRGQISKDKISITKHAYDRFRERVINADVTEKQLQSFAAKARYKGLDLRNINKNDFKQHMDLYQHLKHNFEFYTNTQDIRLYGGFVFIFAGKKGRTLVTIVDVPLSLWNPNEL